MAGPFVAALLLPPAAGQLALLADPRPDVVVGAVAVLVATVVTWLLAAWSGLVCVAVVGSRLPGATGAVARRTLVSITPATLRRVVLAAAGVSVAAGLAACASPVSAATAGAAAQAVVSSAPMSGPAVAPDVTVDLDWPVAVASSERPVTSGDPSTASAADPAASGASVQVPRTPSRTATTSAPVPPTPSRTAAAVGAPPPTPSGTPAADAAPPRVAAAPGPSTQDPLAGTASVSATQPEQESTSHAAADPTAMAATSGVIVRPGDSLWSIAAAQLPAGATAGQIDATWRAWYRANRDVIGPDPNLVLPGQVLQAPQPNTALSTTFQEISR